VWRRAKLARRRQSRRIFAAGESPNARNVKNLHYLIYPGIVKNPKLQIFPYLLYHKIVQNPEILILLYQHNPFNVKRNFILTTVAAYGTIKQVTRVFFAQFLTSRRMTQ
jgi:hypothetical protein